MNTNLQFRKILANPQLCIGFFIIGFWVIIGFFSSIISPFSPYETLIPLQKPFTFHEKGFFLLGTDILGRDIFSRLSHGTKTIFLWVSLSIVSSYFFGTMLGLISGYFGGKIDIFCSFIANSILSFPVMVLYIVIISIIGASGVNIIIAVTFYTGPAIYRIVRSLVLDIKTRDFVSVALTQGDSHFRIIFYEILPNCTGPMIVDVCLRFGYTVITVGVLGFLGLGLPPPTPDWGSMINEGKAMALNFPHLVIFPCIAISSLVLGLNLIADGLRKLVK